MTGSQVRGGTERQGRLQGRTRQRQQKGEAWHGKRAYWHIASHHITLAVPLQAVAAKPAPYFAFFLFLPVLAVGLFVWPGQTVSPQGLACTSWTPTATAILLHPSPCPGGVVLGPSLVLILGTMQPTNNPQVLCTVDGCLL